MRYEFPGRKIIDAIIDMPFALPTAVSGIALTTVFAQNGWIGQYLEPLGIKVAYTWIGITVALTLIGMPFVVRTVQPALAGGADAISRMPPRRSAPAASTCSAASSCRPCCPRCSPASRWRSRARVGEYGSVIFIAGNMPMKTEITPLLIVIRLEEFDYEGAAALGVRDARRSPS